MTGSVTARKDDAPAAVQAAIPPRCWRDRSSASPSRTPRTASASCASRPEANRDLVTVVGHSAEISAGDWVTLSGTWMNNREHGPQFKASFLRTSAPTNAEGIEKYLGSGMTRG